ncbi:MICOS complex subunit MIC13 homolog QIL1 [Schistocerca gregaria]|uniref:MICOS complex subunit MIC13 homolog QIL1 n=1 Tax=Schistocerca gregaria TaxID=7010 RepID=UPI00211DB4BA|nr:MICOS complex subunit MIC13 homolog QIL1 [Schistocerca gregaria]
MVWGLIKFGLKAGVAGGAVYYTVEQGVWNDSNRTTELHRRIQENMRPLIQQIPIDMKIPDLPKSGELSHDAQHLWNSGVKATFSFLGDLPSLLTGWSIQGYQVLREQLSSSQQTNQQAHSTDKKE